MSIFNCIWSKPEPEKTLELYLSEKSILQTAGLGNQIKDKNRISVEENSLEKISVKIAALNLSINKEYYSSYGNRALYWLGLGKICEQYRLHRDLKWVHKNLQGFWRSNFEKSWKTSYEELYEDWKPFSPNDYSTFSDAWKAPIPRTSEIFQVVMMMGGAVAAMGIMGLLCGEHGCSDTAGFRKTFRKPSQFFLTPVVACALGAMLTYGVRKLSYRSWHVVQFGFNQYCRKTKEY